LTDAIRQRRNRLKGIGLICLAVIFFACLDTTQKYLNGYMDSVQVVWARYTGGFLVALIMFNPVSRPGLMKTSRPWLQLGRSLLLVSSSLLMVWALRWLQLDQATAIMFSTPFLVAILSGPFLGEHFGWRRWCAITFGFLGVLVVTRVGFGGVHPAALLCVIGVGCYGFYLIATRLLSRTDSNQTTLFYSNLLGAVLLCVAVPFVWTTPKGPVVIALMCLSGALGSIGHYLLIMAHRLASPGVLAPFLYTQLIWVIALGFVTFGNLPDHWTLSGAAIVVVSGLYLLHREHKLGRRVVTESLVE
jgi:drug/metabolite transporter (DMT)-like permease